MGNLRQILRSFFGIIPLIYCMQVKPEYIVPFTIWDLFKWELRMEDNPSNFLHYWVYPFILLALLTVYLRDRRALEGS